MNKLIEHNIYHFQREENSLYTVAQALADRTAAHMMLGDISRVKRVCKEWNWAFNQNDICKRVASCASFDLLQRSSFHRLVIALQQIDVSPSPKLVINSYRQGHSLINEIRIITQGQYESFMLSKAIDSARGSLSKTSDVNYLIFSNEEMKVLFRAAEVLSTQYYKYVLIPKIVVIPSDKILKFDENRYYYKNTIGETLSATYLRHEAAEDFLAHIDKVPSISLAYSTLKDLIIQYQLFPTTEDNHLLPTVHKNFLKANLALCMYVLSTILLIFGALTVCYVKSLNFV